MEILIFIGGLVLGKLLEFIDPVDVKYRIYLWKVGRYIKEHGRVPSNTKNRDIPAIEDKFNVRVGRGGKVSPPTVLTLGKPQIDK